MSSVASRVEFLIFVSRQNQIPNTDIHLLSIPGNKTCTTCAFFLTGHIGQHVAYFISMEKEKDGDTEIGEQEMVKFSGRIS